MLPILHNIWVCLSLPIFGVHSHCTRTADNVGAVLICEMS